MLRRLSRLEREIAGVEAAAPPISAAPPANLLDFTCQTFPQYRPDPAHELIAATLDRVVSGEIKRLMIFAPPQHGKSELVSVRLPAYWLGKRSNAPVILTSYGAELAQRMSRAARGVVESVEYARLFPGVTTRQDSRAVTRWQLAAPHRGEQLAVGVGGPVTGSGGLLGIIDDPFENWEQAQSQTIRNKVWDFWRGTFRTRIWEGGAVVLVMTRWNADDLAGRLLSSQGDRWFVLRLPALAETQEERDANDAYLGLPVGNPDPLGRAPGEPLCPGRFSKAALVEIQGDVGPMVWAAEYQGVPRPREGTWLKRHYFPIVEAAPVNAQRVRYWDTAGTHDAGCATAGVLLALADGVVYVEDVVRGFWTPAPRDEVILQTARMDRARGRVLVYVEQGPGDAGKAQVGAIIRKLAGFTVRADRPTGDKDTRLEPFISQAEAGNVRMVRGAWNQDYLDELTAVPNGKYRDQADATAGAYNVIAPARRKAGKAYIIRR